MLNKKSWERLKIYLKIILVMVALVLSAVIPYELKTSKMHAPEVRDFKGTNYSVLKFFYKRDIETGLQVIEIRNIDKINEFDYPSEEGKEIFRIKLRFVEFDPGLYDDSEALLNNISIITNSGEKIPVQPFCYPIQYPYHHCDLEGFLFSYTEMTVDGYFMAPQGIVPMYLEKRYVNSLGYPDPYYPPVFINIQNKYVSS